MIKMEQESQVTNPVLEANRLQALAFLDIYLRTPGKGVLNDHQKPVMGALQSFLVRGETAGSIIRPTGAGKTVIATEIIQALGLNTIVVSPTGEILDKTKSTIERFAPELRVSNYDGRLKDAAGQVINTTLASLEKLAAIPAVAESAQLIIVDEVDFGTLGRARHELWKKFPNALFIGLTATPDFSNLDSLKEKGHIDGDERWTGMFTKTIHEMSREEAQEQKALAPLDIHMLATASVVGHVHITKGEYDEEELDRLLNTEARNLQILALLAGVDSLPASLRLPLGKREELRLLHEKIKGKNTIVFGLNISNIESLAQRARDLGVRAAAVHGKLTREQQALLTKAHRNGKLPVLLGVDMVARGADFPATEVGIFARPRRTDTPVIQEVGRLLRLSEETGKERALAIQLVDTFEDMADAPVLIPEVMDPAYILRGSKGWLNNSQSKRSEGAQRDATITISGMDFETIEELMTQAIMRRKIESAGSVSEISDIMDDVISSARPGSQKESVVQFYRKIANVLPGRIIGDVQRLALEAIVNTEPDEQEREKIRKMGQKVFLLLNLKTVFSVLAPQFSANEANNEEVFQTALIQLMGRLEGINPNGQIASQISGMLRTSEVIEEVAKQEGVPYAWVRYKKAIDIVTAIDTALIKRAETSYDGLEEREIDELVAGLVAETGYEEGLLKEIVLFRQKRAIGEEDTTGTDITFQAIVRERMEEELDKVLATLSEREEKVIRLRNNLDENHEDSLTLDEIGFIFGMSREGVRIIENKAMHKLRHPSRSKALEDYLES